MTVVKKIPQRKCVGCGENKDKKQLIRVIKTAEDAILLDETGKKNGRGAYICTKMDCLNKAIKSKGLERSLKTAIPKPVYDELLKEMEKFETR